MSILNQGTINSNITGKTLKINTNKDGLKNEGTLKASNGGTLEINDTLVENYGEIKIDSNSFFALDGTLNQYAGSLFVEGIATANLFDIKGGEINGDGTLNGDVLLGGTLSPGNSPGILTINGGLSTSIESSFWFEIEGNTPGSYDQIIVNGPVNISSGTIFNFDFSNYDFGILPLGETSYLDLIVASIPFDEIFDCPFNFLGIQDNINFQIMCTENTFRLSYAIVDSQTHVPEPNSLILFSLGLIIFAYSNRKRCG